MTGWEEGEGAATGEVVEVVVEVQQEEVDLLAYPMEGEGEAEVEQQG